MAQVTLYIDDETARRLASAAERDHVSKSAWAARAITKELDNEHSETRMAAILALAGKWQDDRSAEQIVADIKSYPPQRERQSID